MAQARARAPGSQALLYERLVRLVDRLVGASLGADAEKRDVMHDAFLQIFRSIGSLREPERLEQWAAQVAVNTIRRELRTRKRRSFTPCDAFEDPGPLTSAPDLEGLELVTRARRVLEGLPADERSILSQVLLEVVTVQQVAERSGCSVSTAKRRLRRARRRLTRLAKRDPALGAWLEERAVPERDCAVRALRAPRIRSGRDGSSPP